MPISCVSSLFPSCLPSRRSLVFKFFNFFCRLASSRIPASNLNACLVYILHSLKPCMHVRFSGCVVIPIVIQYYRNYMYSTLNLPYMIGLNKSSRIYFTANEKARCILWFSRTKGISPPSLFNLMTLITYLFSFLLFVCLACSCASLYTYPSPHHLTCTGIGLSTEKRDLLPVFFSLTQFDFFSLLYLSLSKHYNSALLLLTYI